jgi:xylan 1,4-beta-xylosidase
MKNLFLLICISLLISTTNGYGQKKRKQSNAITENIRLISADLQNVKGKLYTQFNECVGAGRANEGLRADWQSQLAYARKECGFKYIRMHGLLTDDMGVYREDRNGNPQYNWQYIDKLYDFLESIGMRPFVELGFMPKALASGERTIFWWNGNVTPPKDYKKWGDFMQALAQHFTDRYGADEVSKWYFEVWNEPNLTPFFFTGSQEDYFKLYDVTARAIKSVNKNYKVGGPATAGSGWIKEFIDFCVKNNSPVDFVSTHCYGVDQGFLDEYGQRGTVLSNNPKSIWAEIKHSRQLIDESPLPNLELHYTEWSSSYTPHDPVHDNYISTPYILDKIKKVGNDVNSMSYWVFTDIFEEAGPRFTPFHGGFGLINYQGIDKPAFYAYKFLNELGKTELTNSDSTSWVCKDSKGDIQVLFWNLSINLPDSVNNQVYFQQILPSKPAGKVKVHLNNADEGQYLMKVYKTGYKVNDPYTTYLEMGAPDQLSVPQVNAIKQMDNGEPVLTKIIKTGADKVIDEEFNMRENDVYFVEFVKL